MMIIYRQPNKLHGLLSYSSLLAKSSAYLSPLQSLKPHDVHQAGCKQEMALRELEIGKNLHKLLQNDSAQL